MPRSPWAAGPLDRLARVVNVPTIVDGYDVLLAVVARPAAHGRGARAKATAAGSHAVARRVALGTEAVGFLEPAVFGLRVVGHPARAAAPTTEIIAVHASCLYFRTALTQSRRSEGCNPYSRSEVISAPSNCQHRARRGIPCRFGLHTRPEHQCAGSKRRPFSGSEDCLFRLLPARAISTPAAGVGGFSLLAVLVYVADEYPAFDARAGTQALEAGVVRL
jgi:hypothetical protein